MAPPAPGKPRPAFSFRAVAAGMAMLGIAIVAVAAALYFRFVRYERVALRHVPASADVVVRFDVEQAVLYEPVRRHLLPLLAGPRASAEEGDRALTAFGERSGLHRGDLRELVLARAGADGWVLIVAGIFPKGDTRALAAAMGGGFRLAPDGRAATFEQPPVAVGRAPDGAVLIAATEAMVRAALAPATPAPPISTKGPASATATGPALAELARTGALGPLEPALFAELARARAEVSFTDRIEASLLFDGLGAGSEGRAAQHVLEILRSLARGETATPFLRGGAERARLEPASGRTVTLRVAWEREELDPAFAWLGSAIRSRFQGFTARAVLTRP